MTYVDAARLERVETNTIRSRLRRRFHERVEVADRGRNGKPVWGILVASLSPEARRRHEQELGLRAKLAAADNGDGRGQAAEHSLAGENGDAREGTSSSHTRQSASASPAATREEHEEHDVRAAGHSPILRDGVPVLASDPTIVWEAGLVATRSAKCVREFRRRRRAVLALQLAQSSARHGQNLHVARCVAREQDVNWRTLLRWQSAHRRGGEAALVPAWSKREGSRTIPKRLQHELEAFYAQPTRPSIAQCHRYARDWWLHLYEQTGELVPLPSYHAVRRFVGRLLETRPALVEASRHGRKRHRDRYGFHVRRDPLAMPLGACAVLDHRCLDTHIILPSGKIGRPWMTAIGDIHSADIAWVLRPREQLNSDAIACAFRRHILGYEVWDPTTDQWFAFPAHGVPQCAYVDRGKDFQAKRFGRTRRRDGTAFSPKGIELDPEHAETLFGSLQIQRVSALPFSARSKPIESWFSSFATRFENLIAGHCGRNVDDKPEELKRKRRNGELLHWVQYAGVLARCIMQWRIEQPIGPREQAPADYWLDVHPDLPDPARLDTLLLRKAGKKVQGRGITIQWGKREYHFLSDDSAFVFLGGVELDIRWTPDDLEHCIAIHPRTGERWTLSRSDLRGESWRMMFGLEPGDAQKRVQRAASRQNKAATAYIQRAAQLIHPDLADPTGSLRVAASNRSAHAAIKRDLARQAPAPPANQQSAIGEQQPDPPDDYLATLSSRDPLDALLESDDGHTTP